MPARRPEGPPPPPVVQRLRVRYAKRDRLRFTSHRDLARALERGCRQAGWPLAYSAGFTAHPKISYGGAAPTGAASEAEYVDVGLSARIGLSRAAAALDAALPAGLDVRAVVELVAGAPSLGDVLQASRWSVQLAGVTADEVRGALAELAAAGEVTVRRVTREGSREVPLGSAIVSCTAQPDPDPAPRAILTMVVRHTTPAVRPDDVLTGLASVTAFRWDGAPVATRLEQGPLLATGEVGDPLIDGASPDGVTERSAPVATD